MFTEENIIPYIELDILMKKKNSQIKGQPEISWKMAQCACRNAPTPMYQAYKIFYIWIHHELEEVLHLSTHHQILIPTLLVFDGWEGRNTVANREKVASLPTKRDEQGIRNTNIIPFLDIMIRWMQRVK